MRRFANAARADPEPPGSEARPDPPPGPTGERGGADLPPGVLVLCLQHLQLERPSQLSAARTAARCGERTGEL